MKYTVEISKKLEKVLKSIPRADVIKIRDCIRDLEKEPRPSGIEKLADADNLYRVRQGKYRIIYEIHDTKLVIIVVAIGHRKEIYKRL